MSKHKKTFKRSTPKKPGCSGCMDLGILGQWRKGCWVWAKKPPTFTKEEKVEQKRRRSRTSTQLTDWLAAQSMEHHKARWACNGHHLPISRQWRRGLHHHPFPFLFHLESAPKGTYPHSVAQWQWQLGNCLPKSTGIFVGWWRQKQWTWKWVRVRVRFRVRGSQPYKRVQ